MLLYLIVLARVLANPFSNVFQKLLTRRDADPLFIILATHALVAAACLPFLFIFNLTPPPPIFWRDMTIVAVLTVAGNALLVQAVKRSDLSVLGPVNAYKSVIGLVPGLVLLGEVPRPLALAGIALIVAGSYFLVDRTPRAPATPAIYPRRRNAFVRLVTERGVQYRFAAMALAAIEAAYLKRALLHSAVFPTFAAWAVLGLIAAASVTPILLRRNFRPQLAIARTTARTYLALAASVGLMQGCTILVLGGFEVGPALALFQTSTLLSVLLGWRIFKEPDILRRLIGSLIMIGGAVLIVVARA
jgi:drug/metabolite transporter (DMT)-like permease